MSRKFFYLPSPLLTKEGKEVSGQSCANAKDEA